MKIKKKLVFSFGETIKCLMYRFKKLQFCAKEKAQRILKILDPLKRY